MNRALLRFMVTGPGVEPGLGDYASRLWVDYVFIPTLCREPACSLYGVNPADGGTTSHGVVPKILGFHRYSQLSREITFSRAHFEPPVQPYTTP